ncbi:MAG: DUF1285 domain-containing protein [Alphaproteobacteria bacterium]|nr:MAG: DUF1285 domain-containing protein [Alphaproteobacteria bacterium]
MREAASEHYPPVESWEPEYCGNIDIRIAADGTWYHEGRPIRRPELVKLFSRVLRRDDDGHHYLVTPVEKMRIRVDDAPLHVSAMQLAGSGREQRIVFRTLTDDRIPLDADHPIVMRAAPTTGEPRPYVRARGALDALVLRPVYYELAEYVCEAMIDGRVRLGVWSAGSFFPLDEPQSPTRGNAG